MAKPHVTKRRSHQNALTFVCPVYHTVDVFGKVKGGSTTIRLSTGLALRVIASGAAVTSELATKRVLRIDDTNMSMGYEDAI